MACFILDRGYRYENLGHICNNEAEFNGAHGIFSADSTQTDTVQKCFDKCLTIEGCIAFQFGSQAGIRSSECILNSGAFCDDNPNWDYYKIVEGMFYYIHTTFLALDYSNGSHDVFITSQNTKYRLNYYRWITYFYDNFLTLFEDFLISCYSLLLLYNQNTIVQYKYYLYKSEKKETWLCEVNYKASEYESNE